MSMFQRRHYEAVAKALKDTCPAREAYDHYEYVQWRHDIMAMSAMFKKDNGDFQPLRFKKACGVVNDA